MKKIFLVLILSHFNLVAQENWEQDSAWVEERKAIISELDHIFANLDKNKIKKDAIDSNWLYVQNNQLFEK